MALLATGAQGPGEAEAPARRLYDADPFAAEGVPRQAEGVRVRAAAANDMYGVCSIEDFPPGIGDLSLTHDNAWGFYDYVDQFVTPNFWFQDGNVLSWIYGETYDNWQDFYGFDACTVVYHSGHGDMDGNGVFWMPMGGTWGGTSWASSNDLRVGNEMARYIFLSTCLSLRVHSGHSPIRTWNASNLGFRMLFGFETVSVDHAGYGKFFFEEWNKNKSFSQAWLDASWRISTAQAPSVVACGATQAEAQDRLSNERLFYRGSVSKNWWWWRWYDAARRVATRELTLPDAARSTSFLPPDLSGRHLAELAEHYGIDTRAATELTEDNRGAILGADRDGPTLTVDRSGTLEICLAHPDGGGDAPGADDVMRIAQAAVQSYSLADEVDLVADRVRHAYTAGASTDERAEPRIQETIVVFNQVVDGVSIVTPGIGEVRVSVNGEGTVTRIVDATRRVSDVADRPAAVTPPPDNGQVRSPRRPGLSSVDELLDAPLQRLLRTLSAGGHVPTQVRTVPDSTDIGYSLQGTHGRMVAQRTVEVDFGQGLRKRYLVEAPVSG